MKRSFCSTPSMHKSEMLFQPLLSSRVHDVGKEQLYCLDYAVVGFRRVLL